MNHFYSLYHKKEGYSQCWVEGTLEECVNEMDIAADFYLFDWDDEVEIDGAVAYSFYKKGLR